METKRKEETMIRIASAKKAEPLKEKRDKTSRKVETTGCPRGNARGFSEISTHTQRMEDIMKEITFNGKENIEEELEIEKEQCRRKMNKKMWCDRHNTQAKRQPGKWTTVTLVTMFTVKNFIY